MLEKQCCRSMVILIFIFSLKWNIHAILRVSTLQYLSPNDAARDIMGVKKVIKEGKRGMKRREQICNVKREHLGQCVSYGFPFFSASSRFLLQWKKNNIHRNIKKQFYIVFVHMIMNGCFAVWPVRGNLSGI